MHVRFVSPDLRSLDGLSCEALALPWFSDERPLRGVLGLVDWRMCGLVSRAVKAGRLRGTLDERVILPGRPKLAMDKVIVFGLGAKDEFGPGLLRGAVARMLETLAAACVRSAAVVLPGRDVGAIDPETAIEALMSAEAAGMRDEVVVIEPPAAQRLMTGVIERERRRARARGA
jgi:hypothetical protein